MIKLKIIIAVLFLNIFSLGFGKNKFVDKADFDTVYSIDYVYSIAGKKNNPAQFILDSIERRESANNYNEIPKSRILLARGYVASRDLHPNLAIYYVKNALKIDEIQNNANDYIDATSLLGNEYFILNRIDESVKYSLLSIERAKVEKNYNKYALGILNFWVVYSESQNRNRAIKEIHEARNILRTSSERADSTHVIWSLEVEADIYMKMNKYESAISLYEQILSIYNSMSIQARKGTEVELQNDMDFKIGQTHITLAMLYAQINRNDVADKHYKLWKDYHDNIPVVLSGQVYTTAIEYMKYGGKYNEALEYSMQHLNLASEGDSINILSLAIRRQLGLIYMQMKDYKQAWVYENKASIMADSLYNRANYSTAIEMATIYETEAHQSKIYEQEIIIARNQLYIVSILIFTLAVIVIAFIVFLHSKKIKQKNVALFKQIEMLSDVQKKIEYWKRAMGSIKSNDVESNLFAKLDKCMEEKQLFLNAEITRENIAEELCTNKVYLSTAIRNHTDLTFSEYINQLRLEYAKNLLLNNIDIKIEAVSIMSGFKSVRTFYRLFQKEYNLTPTEFKSLTIYKDE